MHSLRTGESYFPSVERANEVAAYALDVWLRTVAERLERRPSDFDPGAPR